MLIYPNKSFNINFQTTTIFSKLHELASCYAFKSSKIEKTFEVVKLRGDSKYFREINRRFQAIFHFFIDGASFIDNDPGWHYFICYLDNKVVGFTSVLENQKRPQGAWESKDQE